MCNKNLFSTYFFLIATLFFSGCANVAEDHKAQENIYSLVGTQASTPDSSTQTLKTPRITIWIHGTHFWFNKMFPSLTAQSEGIYLASDLPEKYLYRNLIVDRLCKMDPHQFCYEHFYILSWSGVLSSKARLQAAKVLVRDLKRICANYAEKYGAEPEICLITHSHGGNVALNIELVNDPDNPVIIDKLVMLAVPVQVETEPFVKSRYFKRVYSLYSTYDMIQIGDMQKFAYSSDDPRRKNIPLFSGRKFAPSENLLQAKVRFDGIGPFHISFILSTFVCALPRILSVLDGVKLPHETCDPMILHLKRNKIPILFSET